MVLFLPRKKDDLRTWEKKYSRIPRPRI